MAKRGHPHTPTKILELRGSWRAKKRHDPDVEHGIPTMPAYLDEAQTQIWQRLTQELNAAGLLAKLDGDMLGRYCVLYTLWRRALEFIREHGETYTTDTEESMIHCYPQVALLSRYHTDLLRIEGQFGMSPSARAALGMQLATMETASAEPTAPGKPKTAKAKSRLFSVG